MVYMASLDEKLPFVLYLSFGVWRNLKVTTSIWNRFSFFFGLNPPSHKWFILSRKLNEMIHKRRESSRDFRCLWIRRGYPSNLRYMYIYMYMTAEILPIRRKTPSINQSIEEMCLVRIFLLLNILTLWQCIYLKEKIPSDKIFW